MALPAGCTKGECDDWLLKRDKLCCAVAMERNLWQSPVEAGAISARGRQQVRCSPAISACTDHPASKADPALFGIVACQLGTATCSRQGEGISDSPDDGHACVQAAESEVAAIMVVITSRGCKEIFVPNPELLAEGKVCKGQTPSSL